MSSIVTRVCLVLLAATALPLGPPAPARAAVPELVPAAAETAFLEVVNRERADAGLRALQGDPGLADIARRHSMRMRAAGALFHNPRLAQEVPKPWAEIAENIGRGTDTAILDRTFMLSETHRANVLGNFDRVGVGIAASGRSVYVTEVFVRTGG